MTHLQLAWYDLEQNAALAEIADHWEQLRSVEFGGLMKFDARALARFAAGEAVTRLESLVVVRARDSLRHFEIPQVRIDRPTRLRHVGLRAPDLIHLLRNDLVPDLKSAEVLVANLDEARELAATDCTADAFTAEFPRLRHLDLSENHFGADRVRELLAARMPVLQHLDLSGGRAGSPHYDSGAVQPIGDAGAEVVARCWSCRWRLWTCRAIRWAACLPCRARRRGTP